jgi:hypothetical protein
LENRVTSTNTLEVNSERLWATIERSAEIGRFRGTGLRRLALSSEDAVPRDNQGERRTTITMRMAPGIV